MSLVAEVIFESLTNDVKDGIASEQYARNTNRDYQLQQRVAFLPDSLCINDYHPHALAYSLCSPPQFRRGSNAIFSGRDLYRLNKR